jgi:hypothetical protein
MWRVATDCRSHYQNKKPPKGITFFKTVEIHVAFENTKMKLFNYVSSARWQGLHGLSPQPFFIL